MDKQSKGQDYEKKKFKETQKTNTKEEDYHTYV